MPLPMFSVGQRVFHPRFGEGVVRSVGANGADLKVYFDSFGDLARVNTSSLMNFKEGDTVRHPDYGIGTVRGFAAKSGLLNVHFDHVGGTAPVYASRLVLVSPASPGASATKPSLPAAEPPKSRLLRPPPIPAASRPPGLGSRSSDAPSCSGYSYRSRSRQGPAPPDGRVLAPGSSSSRQTNQLDRGPLASEGLHRFGDRECRRGQGLRPVRARGLWTRQESYWAARNGIGP